MQAFARYAYVGLAWLFFIGVVIQVFLAGIGLLGNGGMEAHIGFGYLLPMITILLALAAWPAHPDRGAFRMTMVLLVLTLIQPNLPLLRDASPIIAALHPVNALVIFWLGLAVARRSIALLAGRAGAPDDVGAPQEA